MRELAFFVSFVLLFSAEAAAVGRLIVCGGEELFIFDLHANKKIWTWKAADRPELPADLRTQFRTIDECKPVDGGKRILITASSDGVALIERTNGRVVFYATVANAHSAEVLPAGRIAVAASHRPNGPGDRVILFDIAESGKELFHTELSWAHGVVWDDARKLLWAIGHDDLMAYKLLAWDTASPSLAVEARYKLPDPDGHDLYSVPGTSMLSATTGKHAWLFDRESRKFSEHPDLGTRPGVKCIQVNAKSGQIVWVLSEGGNWWSDKLRFLKPEATITLPGERIYKARWLPE